MNMTPETAPDRTEVQFVCHGQATGKMRNDLSVQMTRPFEEPPIAMATDEGAFHGGDASAPPPLAYFTAGLTGCLMTQLRAFSRRMGVQIDDLRVETRLTWDWEKVGAVYETGPKGFEIDIFLESPDPFEKVALLVAASRKGCFIEQTLGQANTIRHRIRTPNGFVTV